MQIVENCGKPVDNLRLATELMQLIVLIAKDLNGFKKFVECLFITFRDCRKITAVIE